MFYFYLNWTMNKKINKNNQSIIIRNVQGNASNAEQYRQDVYVSCIGI